LIFFITDLKMISLHDTPTFIPCTNP
jgi:hypothetical protein